MPQRGAISSGRFVAELELVFFRLSAIDLCQARCVCREWRRAIDDPSFRQGYARSHRCIPHLCLLLDSGSLLVKPVEPNSPRCEWRHFQTLPTDMTIASTDAGLLCLATFAKWWAPSSIFVWRYSDLNSSPVRVPLPPVSNHDTDLTVYCRERDRSTREFCVASFDRPSLAFYIYDSASGEWSLRENEDYPDSGAMLDENGFYPILDHGEVVVLCTDTWSLARYNVWHDSWRIFKLDSRELEFGETWSLLQLDRDRLFVVTDEGQAEDREGLIVAERRGDKWEIVSRRDEEFDDLLVRAREVCTDGSNSIWLVDRVNSRIVHFGVDSRSWSLEEAPDGVTGFKELAWFSC